MVDKEIGDSNMSAMEVSRELGYSDPYFFYRQFRRKTGMTPTKFRDSFIVKKP